MSERLRGQLTMVSLIVGILIGVWGAIQSVAVIPYRLDAVEKTVTQLQTQGRIDRETIIRIEEKLNSIKETQQKILERLPK